MIIKIEIKKIEININFNFKNLFFFKIVAELNICFFIIY